MIAADLDDEALVRRKTPRYWLSGRKSQPLNERILAGVATMQSGCWEWQRARKKPEGYGFIKIAGRMCYAHRVAYEQFIGPIGEGLFVCHRCDNPACCNPEHLFLGTHTDNMRDMHTKKRWRPGTPRPSNPMGTTLHAEKVRLVLADSRPSHLVAADIGVSGATVRRIRLFARRERCI